MNELIATTKIVLGNTFVMYFKAHSYHWNVEGKNFSQYHDFFGDIYEELHDAIDGIAEEIRALDAYAPISLEQLYNSKTIVEDTTKPESCLAMVSNLLNANDQVILSLNKLFAVASAENDQGIADFAASRLDIHKKHGWMLRSFLKSGE
jgi:starvation-inducible DNA-binding protein